MPEASLELIVSKADAREKTKSVNKTARMKARRAIRVPSLSHSPRSVSRFLVCDRFMASIPLGGVAHRVSGFYPSMPDWEKQAKPHIPSLPSAWEGSGTHPAKVARFTPF